MLSFLFEPSFVKTLFVYFTLPSTAQSILYMEIDPKDAVRYILLPVSLARRFMIFLRSTFLVDFFLHENLLSFYNFISWREG